MAKSEKLKYMETRRETIKMALRTLRSDIENPARLERDAAKYEAQAALLLDKAKWLRARQASLSATLAEYASELVEVNKAISFENHDGKIAAIQKLAQAMVTAHQVDLQNLMLAVDEKRANDHVQ